MSYDPRPLFAEPEVTLNQIVSIQADRHSTQKGARPRVRIVPLPAPLGEFLPGPTSVVIKPVTEMDRSRHLIATGIDQVVSALPGDSQLTVLFALDPLHHNNTQARFSWPSSMPDRYPRHMIATGVSQALAGN